MIYDRLENIEKYRGISACLDTAIAFIASHNLLDLPIGRTDVDGDRVFVTVMDAQAAEESDSVFEYHKQYMDIQIDLNGTEQVQTAQEHSAVQKAYEPDIGLVTASPTAYCTLGPGYFTICMAGELHKPGLAVSPVLYLRKAVFKVAAE